MRKLKLRVEELRVESFDTAGARGGRGTVRGAEDTNESGCMIASCGVTCPLSCEPSCPYGGCDDTAPRGCEGTNASGCVILSCGVTCPLSCEPSCPYGGCEHD